MPAGVAGVDAAFAAERLAVVLFETMEHLDPGVDGP
jgi:hypothetical protein